MNVMPRYIFLICNPLFTFVGAAHSQETPCGWVATLKQTYIAPLVAWIGNKGAVIKRSSIACSQKIKFCTTFLGKIFASLRCYCPFNFLPKKPLNSEVNSNLETIVGVSTQPVGDKQNLNLEFEVQEQTETLTLNDKSQTEYQAEQETREKIDNRAQIYEQKPTKKNGSGRFIVSIDNRIIVKNTFALREIDLERLTKLDTSCELYKASTVTDFKTFLNDFLAVIFVARAQLAKEKEFNEGQISGDVIFLRKINNSFQWLYVLIQKDAYNFEQYLATFNWNAMVNDNFLDQYEIGGSTIVEYTGVLHLSSYKPITSALLKSYANKGSLLFTHTSKNKQNMHNSAYPDMVGDFFQCLAFADRVIDLDRKMGHFQWRDNRLALDNNIQLIKDLVC